MINRGLVQKAVLETWATTLVIGVALFGFEAILAYALPSYFEQISESLMRIPFVRMFLQVMLGSDVAGELGPEAILAFPLVHPVVLALIWAHAVITCTRSPAGEIEQGTIDILLGWPVGRWEILCSETIVTLASGVVLTLLLVGGNIAGGLAVTSSMRPDVPRLMIAVVNLYALYLAVCGLSWLLSSLSDRRGKAMTSVFLILLGSFLLNFLAQFWNPAKKLAFLGPLSYYRPLAILRDGVIPTYDIAVLLACGAVFWFGAGIAFARRDVCTL